MDYFFYGTLMDTDVLARVIGRRLPAGSTEPAVIEGYARVYAAGACYPVLVPALAGRVEGLLVSGIGARAAARLYDFESDSYELRRMSVVAARRRRLSALTFMGRPGRAASLDPWELESWRRRHKREYLGLSGARAAD